MSEKLNIWLGAKETASGYKLVHNLVKRFLTMHGLLLSITVFPDYNKKSQEQKNTLQELGLAKGLSDQEKKPHTFHMEYLFSVIHESVVKSKSLQLRRFALLEMKRNSKEQFTTTLCWIDDAE